MAYTEVLTSGNSAVNSAEKWDNMCHREYTDNLKMKFLMSTGRDAVLQVKEMAKGAGDAFTIHYASKQTGGTVRGNALGIGNEGSMEFYAQRFVVDNTRSLHKVWDIPMQNQRVPFSVLEEARHALSVMHAETFDDDIVDAMCDITVGKVAGRALYGAVQSNYSGTHATDLANIDATNDMLTSSQIGKAKRMAKIKGTGVTEKIRPTRIKNGLKMEEWFILLAHTYCIRDLVRNDAAFRNEQLLLPPRGNANSIYFTGSNFKGSTEGVLIYEYERMPLATNTNSIQTAHNLLLGAQAGLICWGQRTKFGEEFSDLNHNVSYEFHDIRNQQGVGSSNQIKMVRNDGTNTADHGLINVFSAAVADS